MTKHPPRILWHDGHVQEYIGIKLKVKLEEDKEDYRKAEIKNKLWKRVLDAVKAKGFSFEEIKMIYPSLDKYQWENADYHPPMKLTKDQYNHISWCSDFHQLKNPRAKLSYYNEEGVCLLSFIPQNCSGEKVDFIIKNKFFNPYIN